MSIKARILGLLDADHARLDGFLHSADGQVVEKMITDAFGRAAPRSHLEERVWMEEFYRVAQHRGCQLSGWKLRFMIYYYVGKCLGEW